MQNRPRIPRAGTAWLLESNLPPGLESTSVNMAAEDDVYNRMMSGVLRYCADGEFAPGCGWERVRAAREDFSPSGEEAVALNRMSFAIFASKLKKRMPPVAVDAKR